MRAGQCLLLSTTARVAQGASVQSTQMDATEAVAQLKAAQQLGQALSQSAQQQGAQALHGFDAQQAVQCHTDAMCAQAQGKHSGSVNGQEAKKAKGRTLVDPVEKFAKPLVHLDTPVTAAFVTPATISLFSGQDTSLYTHAGGIKAITANGQLSLRAHTDAQQIWADQGITVQSTTDEIRIQASESITLSAGQSAIVIKGGDITFTCPGNWTVKGATHDWGSGGGGGASLMALPSGAVNIQNPLCEPDYSVAFDLKACTDLNLSGESYVAYAKRGSRWVPIQSGVLNEAQATDDILTKGAETVEVFVGDGDWVVLGDDEGGCC